MSKVKFQICPLWNETAAVLLLNNKKLAERIKLFREVKAANPTARFGGSDSMFNGKAPIAKALSERAWHAHLTQDISIVYSVSSRDPTIIKLYGIFRHKDLGTGDTDNIRKQQSVADRMKGQTWNDSVLENKKRRAYVRKK